MRVSCRRLGKFFFMCMILFILSVILTNKNGYLRQSNEIRTVRLRNSAVNVNVTKLNLVNLSSDLNEVNKPNLRLYDASVPTLLDDLFISVKTTEKFHKERMHILLDTWISIARNQTYIFTDMEDPDLAAKIDGTHVVNTKCPMDHNRRSLVCKMAQEFDWFITSKKHWFCHFDDDNYVNIGRLVTFLQQYNHTDDWYLGRPSLNHPVEVIDRGHPGQKFAFWFATGGAGFCISRSLALKMVPYAGGGRFMRVAEQIRLPDDCTIGYIIDTLLRKELTVIKQFHSHLEPLWRLRLPDIKDQLTFSYGYSKTSKTVNIPGFPEDEDPTRFWSIHCHLYPSLNPCITGLLTT